MEQVREVGHEVTIDMFGTVGATPPGENSLVDVDSETVTAMLRRCTALATRARVDLLTPRRDGAAEELLDLLDRMRSWEDGVLAAPDPIMLVLAAAALQDLLERLSVGERAGGGAIDGLAVSTRTVLSLLHEMMGRARIDVPA